VDSKEQAAAELRKIISTLEPYGQDKAAWIERATKLAYWARVLVGE
jgi:hypothetical protein